MVPISRQVWLLTAAGLLTLGGCAETDRYVFHGAFTEAHQRHVNARLYAADVKACGKGPGAEWCRVAADDGNLSRFYPPQKRRAPPPPGVIAYDDSQCTGAVVHGLCQGKSVPRIPPPICHGETIDGVCAGPVF